MLSIFRILKKIQLRLWAVALSSCLEIDWKDSYYAIFVEKHSTWLTDIQEEGITETDTELLDYEISVCRWSITPVHLDHRSHEKLKKAMRAEFKRDAAKG